MCDLSVVLNIKMSGTVAQLLFSTAQLVSDFTPLDNTLYI